MVRTEALPFDLEPSEPGVWEAEMPEVAILGRAPGHTDLYVNPGGAGSADAESLANAPTLLGDPGDGDFQFSARITVDFTSLFDAGVLLLWLDETHFGKFCFEYSPQGDPMVVSVVTRGVSDDANAFTVDAATVWLRISRIGEVYAFHASLDGTRWTMVRVFALSGNLPDHRIGFEVQSPTGGGCSVRFDDFRFARETLLDLRDGQ